MPSLVGLPIAEITTPALIVDKAKVKRNCNKVIKSCMELGVKLRAHTKTHKTIEGVDLVTHGSRTGLVCSTLAECEFFATKKCDDIVYGIPLQRHHFKRVEQLTRALDSFHVMTDSLEIARILSETEPPTGKRWSVLLTLDAGCGREGISWEDYDSGITIGQILNSSKNTLFKGVYVHCGQTYAATSVEEVKKIQDETIDRLLMYVEKLKENGLRCDIYGIGSTPTAAHPSPKIRNLTEIHPGNFVFYDVQQTQLGSSSLEDIAISVATRVIGHYPNKNQILVDCGFTALTKQSFGILESGYAIIKEEPNLKLFHMTQEIGFISTIDEKPLEFEKYPLGCFLYLLPYHACATATCHDSYLVLENGIVKEEWKPVRGW